MRIKNYLNDGTISLTDKIVGSDDQDSGNTKNYTIQDLITFIQSNIDLGADGTFTTADNKTVTVVKGVITSIV